ncbi:hypothetical protein [Marinicellulosiphila megalodicopiae]|uniref:hypothetical protein n=1 Tax=Marinicellulosiphila megalodicopiae TaxID=2724896 RepID=UPI003BAEE2E3
MPEQIIDTKFIQAAKQLLARRVAGTKANGLPNNIKPNNIEDALDIHQAMITLCEQKNIKANAWKCLLPINADKIIIAPIFSDTVQTGDQCKLMCDDAKAKVEPEIAFVLNKDLPAKALGYSKGEINDAIGSAHMALELMQKRFADDTDVSFPEMLADCLVNQGLFIGPQIDKALAFKANVISLSFKQIDKNGEINEQIFEGKHPNALPQLPVYWAIDFMSKRGTSFKKGDAFTTGSFAGIVEVDFDKKTDIEYVGLGNYKVEFKES